MARCIPILPSIAPIFLGDVSTPRELVAAIVAATNARRVPLRRSGATGQRLFLCPNCHQRHVRHRGRLCDACRISADT